LCKDQNVEHLRASDLIKQGVTEARFYEKKRVKDVDGNQSLLIRSLKARISGGGKYLLDGHFTLFGADGNVEKIPLLTFQAIQPRAVGVVADEPAVIVARLQNRDKVGHDVAALTRMQDEELKHAAAVARELGIEFVTFGPADTELFVKWLRSAFRA
jgi:adenylate kinase